MTEQPTTSRQPVTKTMIRQLEAERDKQQAAPALTIGGAIEADVNSHVSAEREAVILDGNARLDNAVAKAAIGFQAAKPDARTEYIRIQRQAARNHPARNMQRQKGPSR